MTIFNALCLFIVIGSCAATITEILTDVSLQEATTNELFGTLDFMSTEPTTETLQTDNNFLGLATIEETGGIETSNGTIFRLSMTILEDWKDEFMNKSSIRFKNLADDLETELMDFIDNALQSSEPNLTNFNLVLACSLSAHETFVTFIISSKKELSEEALRETISNRIIIEGRIYDHNATISGFVFESIDKETAKRFHSGNFSCESVLNMALENQHVLEIKSENDAQQHFSDSDSLDNVEKAPTCKSEKILQGSTAIYIFEAQQECIDGVRNSIQKGEDHHSFVDGDGDEKCTMNTKRSATEPAVDDETVLVIRKRGNKVFIEI